ncbi:MAG: heparin lyase I family protein [Actinobacteria bacterium]|nr:heparin lyase I family protein [Actinomycetota bacterium]
MKTLRSPSAAFVLLICCALLVPAGAGAAGHGRDGGSAHKRRHRATPGKVGAHRLSSQRATRSGKSRGSDAPSAGSSGTTGIGQSASVEGGGSSSGSKHSGTTKPTTPTTPTTPAPPTTPSEPVAPLPAPAPEGKVIFEGLFDGSFSGWYVQSLSYRATINSAHPYEGSAAGRFEVQPGDVEPDTGSQRSEVTGPTFHEGEDIYVRDDIRVPVGYTFQGPWQLIDQLHEKPWSGSPGIATFLDSNRSISFGAGDGSPTYWRGPQLEQERWYDLVYRVNLERNPSEGFVELWLDGVQQTLLNGQIRMYGETIQTAETYLKAGIYRSISSTGVSIVEHDNIVVGTSLAAVMAN